MFQLKKCFCYSSIFLLLSILFVTAFSTLTCTFASSGEQHIFDYADLLTQDEINQLEDEFEQKSTATDISLVFILTYDTDGKSDQIYLEDFYDAGYHSNTIAEDAALILLNMTERNVVIQGYGACEFYLNNDHIEAMLDDIIPKIADEDYYGAASLFATETEYYRNEEQDVVQEYQPDQNYGESYAGSSNYYTEEEEKPFFLKTWFLILVSLFIGACSIGAMAYNSGGRVTTNESTYLSPTSKGLIDRHDQFLYTSTKKIPRPKQKSNNGARSSNGGGRSSGGHSHSGGSRKF